MLWFAAAPSEGVEFCWKRHSFPCLRRRQLYDGCTGSVYPCLGIQQTVLFLRQSVFYSQNGKLPLAPVESKPSAEHKVKQEVKKVELVVFAAASMTETLAEPGNAYMEENGNVEMVFNFDSSGTLKK